MRFDEDDLYDISTRLHVGVGDTSPSYTSSVSPPAATFPGRYSKPGSSPAWNDLLALVDDEAARCWATRCYTLDDKS